MTVLRASSVPIEHYASLASLLQDLNDAFVRHSQVYPVIKNSLPLATSLSDEDAELGVSIYHFLNLMDQLQRDIQEYPDGFVKESTVRDSDGELKKARFLYVNRQWVLTHVYGKWSWKTLEQYEAEFGKQDFKPE